VAALDPAIHVFAFELASCVDARDKPGHDRESYSSSLSRCFFLSFFFFFLSLDTCIAPLRLQMSKRLIPIFVTTL
jgi:hypothetical protein